MNCREARRSMHRRVDREATEHEQHRLDDHLAGCATCRRAERELGETLTALRDATETLRSVPSTHRHNDLQRQSDPHRHNDPRRANGSIRMRVIARRVVAAAAVIAIAVIGATHLLDRNVTEAPTVRSASLEVTSNPNDIAVKYESAEPDVHVFWVFETDRP